jgi:hypothetical protein
LIIGSNAVQAAITEVDAPVQPGFTAGLPFLNFDAYFSVIWTSGSTGKPLTGLTKDGKFRLLSRRRCGEPSVHKVKFKNRIGTFMFVCHFCQ